jgi:DNA-binding transcriptional ArsR family regulator
MHQALQIVAEPRRQEILALVWDHERKAGEIADAVDVSFSAVSQHLKVLRDAKLVRARKAGRERFYRADKAAFGGLGDYLETIWATRLRKLKALAEAAERKSAERRE